VSVSISLVVDTDFRVSEYSMERKMYRLFVCLIVARL
jgi:hypothetical protein